MIMMCWFASFVCKEKKKGERLIRIERKGRALETLEGLDCRFHLKGSLCCSWIPSEKNWSVGGIGKIANWMEMTMYRRYRVSRKQSLTYFAVKGFRPLVVSLLSLILQFGIFKVPRRKSKGKLEVEIQLKILFWWFGFFCYASITLLFGQLTQFQSALLAFKRLISKAGLQRVSFILFTLSGISWATPPNLSISLIYWAVSCLLHSPFNLFPFRTSGKWPIALFGTQPRWWKVYSGNIQRKGNFV